MPLPDREELVDWLKEKALLLTAGTGVLTWSAYAWLQRPLHPPPGIHLSEEPIQDTPLLSPWTFRNHQFTPLASFEIKARVLSRERYRFDRAAELSPLDLALGWGPMSDSAITEQVNISQSDRWYFWSSSQPPIPPEAITTHSANMHMIPASPRVASTLLSFRPGEFIHLKGHLIKAVGQDGWTWTSSLTRQDTGDGACEVIWVEAAEGLSP